MGREIRRVALDFDWPLGEVWQGFVNPHQDAARCVACDGSGYNVATKQIHDWFYDLDGLGARWHYVYGTAPDGTPAERPPWLVVGESLEWSNRLLQDEVDALVRERRLIEFTHTWAQRRGWVPRDRRWAKSVLGERRFWRLARKARTRARKRKFEHRASRYEVAAAREIPHVPAALVNEWADRGMGHDAINCRILVEARAKRLGVYGLCPICSGHGDLWASEEQKKTYESWRPIDPPTGDGWQLWETVSEGSPVSPVFSTADELIEWMVENGDGGSGSSVSREAAEAFVRGPGWVPSAVGIGTSLKSGVEACADLAKTRD